MAAEKTTNSELKDMMCDIINKLDVLSKEVTHLTYRVAQVERSVGSIEHVHQSLTANVAYVNSLNIMFYGVQFQPGTTLDATFRNFMIETLHADPEKVKNMPFHVQYLPKMSQIDLHPPICVTFRFQKDSEYIQHKTNKYMDSLHQQGIRAGGKTDLRMHQWKS